MIFNNIYIIIVLFLFSCTSTQIVPVSVKDTHSANELFLKAEKQFHKQSYNKALKLYKEYIEKFPQGIKSPAALMRIGAIYIIQKDYQLARDNFNLLITQFPKSKFLQEAKNEILKTYYDQGNFSKVIKYAPEIIKTFVSEKDLQKAYNLLIDAYLSLGYMEDAAYYCYILYNTAGIEEKDAAGIKLKKILKSLNTVAVENILENFTDNQFKGYLLYLRGVIETEQGNHENALYFLSTLIEKYPGNDNISSAVNLITDIKSLSTYNHYTIGCLLPLTGSFKVYGQNALRGIEIALLQFASSHINSPIKLIIKDTCSDKKKAVSGVEELFEEKIAAIIGPILTAENAAVIAQSKGIPIITITQKDNITNVGNYVFRNFFTPEMQVKTIISYATEQLGLGRFAILYPEDDYGKSFMNLFWDEVIKQGGKIVGIESYNTNQTDYADSIKKIIGLYYDIPERLVENENLVEDEEKEKPTDTKNKSEAIVDFEAIFIPEESKRAGLIVPQLVYYDINDVQIFGTNLWHSANLIKMARRYVQGAIMPDIFFAESSSPQVKNFTMIFEETFCYKPGFIEAIAYDTAMILFETVVLPNVNFRSSIRNEIINRSSFSGVTGDTAFRPNGEALKELHLLQIKGSGFEEIK